MLVENGEHGHHRACEEHVAEVVTGAHADGGQGVTPLVVATHQMRLDEQHLKSHEREARDHQPFG